MEIVQNRYGNDRVIEKISPTKLRIMGESLIARGSQDESGNQTMFDFEGGPVLSVGGNITFQKLKWKIEKIEPIQSKFEGLSECILTVSPKY